MSEEGYVYVMINPSLEGLLKIGRTKRDPNERAKELSAATGVATPFYVAYKTYFLDCETVEEFLHEKLAQYRLTENREFFKAPLDTAIEAILEAKNFFRQEKEEVQERAETGKDATESGRPEPSPNSVCEELETTISTLMFHSGDEPDKILEGFELAKKALKLNCIQEHIFCRLCMYLGDCYFNGSSGFIQKFDDAFEHYKLAADKSHREAFKKIGDLYKEGEHLKQDKKKAVHYYWQGVKSGDTSFWTEIADINMPNDSAVRLRLRLDKVQKSSSLNDVFKKWNQYWHKYFSSSFFKGADAEEGACAPSYSNAFSYLIDLDKWKSYGILKKTVSIDLVQPIIEKAEVDIDFRQSFIGENQYTGDLFVQAYQSIVDKIDKDGQGYWYTTQRIVKAL